MEMNMKVYDDIYIDPFYNDRWVFVKVDDTQLIESSDKSKWISYGSKENSMYMISYDLLSEIKNEKI